MIEGKAWENGGKIIILFLAFYHRYYPNKRSDRFFEWKMIIEDYVE